MGEMSSYLTLEALESIDDTGGGPDGKGRALFAEYRRPRELGWMIAVVVKRH